MGPSFSESSVARRDDWFQYHVPPAGALAGLGYSHPQAKLPQPVELVEPGHAGADHDGVDFGLRFRSRFFRV